MSETIGSTVFGTFKKEFTEKVFNKLEAEKDFDFKNVDALYEEYVKKIKKKGITISEEDKNKFEACLLLTSYLYIKLKGERKLFVHINKSGEIYKKIIGKEAITEFEAAIKSSNGIENFILNKIAKCSNQINDTDFIKDILSGIVNINKKEKISPTDKRAIFDKFLDPEDIQKSFPVFKGLVMDNFVPEKLHTLCEFIDNSNTIKSTIIAIKTTFNSTGQQDAQDNTAKEAAELLFKLYEYYYFDTIKVDEIRASFELIDISDRLRTGVFNALIDFCKKNIDNLEKLFKIEETLNNDEFFKYKQQGLPLWLSVLGIITDKSEKLELFKSTLQRFEKFMDITSFFSYHNEKNVSRLIYDSDSNEVIMKYGGGYECDKSDNWGKIEDLLKKSHNDEFDMIYRGDRPTTDFFAICNLIVMKDINIDTIADDIKNIEEGRTKFSSEKEKSEKLGSLKTEKKQIQECVEKFKPVILEFLRKKLDELFCDKDIGQNEKKELVIPFLAVFYDHEPRENTRRFINLLKDDLEIEKYTDKIVEIFEKEFDEGRFDSIEALKKLYDEYKSKHTPKVEETKKEQKEQPISTGDTKSEKTDDIDEFTRLSTAAKTLEENLEPGTESIEKQESTETAKPVKDTHMKSGVKAKTEMFERKITESTEGQKPAKVVDKGTNVGKLKEMFEQKIIESTERQKPATTIRQSTKVESSIVVAERIIRYELNDEAARKEEEKKKAEMQLLKSSRGASTCFNK